MRNVLLSLMKKLKNTTIVVDGKDYLQRGYFFGETSKTCGVYLHHFKSSDQKKELHSHPFKYSFSFVLTGGYREERLVNGEIFSRVVKPFTFNFIKSSDFHRVDLFDEENGAFTLFFAGPRSTEWGFLDRETLEFKHYSLNPNAIP